MRSNACPDCNNSASNYYVKKNNFLSIDLMANEVCMSIALQLIFLILSNSVELDYVPLLFPFICSFRTVSPVI